MIFFCFLGGIANIESYNVSAFLDPCFTETKNKILDESMENAQVFFGATAGMRLLKLVSRIGFKERLFNIYLTTMMAISGVSLDSPSTVTEILDAVVHYLETTGLKFNENDIRIISGPVEGLSAWITANYLTETLESHVSIVFTI